MSYINVELPLKRNVLNHVNPSHLHFEMTRNWSPHTLTIRRNDAIVWQISAPPQPQINITPKISLLFSASQNFTERERERGLTEEVSFVCKVMILLILRDFGSDKH